MRVPPLGREGPLGEETQPLQCSCLKNPTDRGAWQAVVRGVAESDTTSLWFFCLLKIQLVHVKVLSSCIVEA